MKRNKFLRNFGMMTGALLTAPAMASRMPEQAWPTLPDPNDPGIWDKLRQHFMFDEKLIYLNTGGIGPVPSLVMNQVQKSWIESERFPKPGHDLSQWNEVKSSIAPLLGPETSIEELALIGCATEGINIILNGLMLEKGDEVITSTHEHPALHVPLLNLMKNKGIKVHFFEPDLKRGSGNTERIAQLINRKTRLIFVSHISCTTGQIFPIQDIARLAHDNKIFLAVDGAQSCGAIPINLRNLGVDFYTCSGHKWMLGPKRTGVLYVAREYLDQLKPTSVGAYSDNGYNIDTGEITLQSSAQRYEFGTANDALFSGLMKGVTFCRSLGIDKIWEHNRLLAEAFYRGLQNLAGVKLLSPEEPDYRSQMISFSVEQKTAQELSQLFSKASIRVRVVNEAKLDAIRVAFHLYNTSAEVSACLDVLK